MKRTGVNEDTRIWCEYCRVFVYNNRINREKHDNSPQHQANFKKKVDILRKEEEQRKKLQGYSDNTTCAASTKSFYQSTSPSSSTSVAGEPVNILNLKSQTKSEKKPATVLGLSSTIIPGKAKTPKVTEVETTEVVKRPEINKSAEIKSFSFDLKRKIKEDEKCLMEAADKEEPVNDSIEEKDALEMLSLLKNKKNKNK